MTKCTFKNVRRFLALLLCVAMVLPMLPLQLPVSAAGEAVAAESLDAVLQQVRDLYTGGVKSETLVYDGGNSVSGGGEKSYMTVVLGTTADHFTAYQAALEAAGYTVQSENTVASKTADNPNRFASYRSPGGKYRVYTYYLYAYGETRIIVDTQVDTVAGFQYEPQAGKTVEPKLVMWGLSMSSMGYDIGEVMDQNQEKKRNCGAMFVIRMADNSLFIHDGGDMRQWSDEACDEFLAFCRELTGTTDEKMVINTWFISHTHRDHFQGFYRFLTKYHDQFDLKYVMYNIDEERADVDVDISGAMKLVRRCYPDAKYYKPHTGEKITIAGVTLDVLYTLEDRYYPDSEGNLSTDADFVGGTYREYTYKNLTNKTSNFNDTTTVIRVTFENGVDSILYGDLALSRQWLLDSYSADVLKTDIMTVPHHGFDDQKELVAAADAKIYLYNQRKSAVYGADDDVTTVEMYGTYHKTLRDNYLKMFTGMNVEKGVNPNVDYEIYWAGNNTVMLDINTLGAVLAGTSNAQYCEQRATVDVEYTGWIVENPDSDIKDYSDRLLSMEGDATTVDTIVNGTYAFRFNPVKTDQLTTDTAINAKVKGQFVNYGIYAIMHKATGKIMSYDSVALTPGRPNRATSLNQVPEAEAASAGLDVFYMYNNNVYIDHSNLDRVSWIIRQDAKNIGEAFDVKTSEGSINWITDTQFGEAAHSYAHTWLYKGLFRETNTLHYWETSTIASQNVNWWYAISGEDANSPVTQYRYLNLRYDDKGWVTNQALDQKYSMTDLRGYQIEYLGQDSQGYGEFIIFWYDTSVEDSSNDKTYCFLTCDENGNWGVKKYTTRTAAQADMENLKLRLYQYETWRRPDNEKTVRYSFDHSVFNVEAGTTVEQLLSFIHENGKFTMQNGENRDYLEVPCSGTEPKVGYYYLEFDKPYDASAKGNSQYTVSVMYCDEATTDTKLTQLTVNVYDRKLGFEGETAYWVDEDAAMSEVASLISQNITVTETFSNIRGNLSDPSAVSYSQNPETGKYWLDFDYGANGSSAYLVKVNYRRSDGSDILVKTLSVYADEPVTEFAEPESKVGIVLLNAELGAIVQDENGQNITVSINGVDRNVTVGMLTKDGLPLDTSEERTYENLTLTYGGQEICTDFTLQVVKGSPALNYPSKGQPGYVGTNKIGTTTETEFAQSGVANIQLSTNGIPAEKGVDMIVIMDLSGSMLNRLDTNNRAPDYQETRVVAMENSLKEMIKTLQTSGTDVRIAMSDFGDLDHFELEGSVVDTSIVGKNMFDMDFDNNQYAESFEFANHLNFVFKEPKFNATYSRYHNPYGIHLTKYDGAQPGAHHGVVIPTVYTGSGKVEANAFVNVDTLYDGTKFTASMKGIINKLDENVQKEIGTNYDKGLEYAYNLGYAIRQDNIAKGYDREIICVFMSDGGPMQFNYFTGTTKTEAWTEWITGRIESIGSNGYSATNLPDGVEALQANLLKMLKAGNLTRPEYQRGPWYENYCYQLGTDGKYTGSSSYTIKDASQGYFIYRDRYQSGLANAESFFDYMNHLAYDLDWDFLCRIAWANGIEEFDEEYYRNNEMLPELVELLLDMEFVGYEHAGNQVYHKVYRTKLKDPGMSEQAYYPQYTGTSTDFFEAMEEIGVDCTWDLVGKIAYKNRASLSDFWTYMGVTPANTSMDKKRTAGAKALELIADQLRTTPDGYSHGTVSPYTYFYNTEGKNWWAEAIKGDVDKLYPVINKYAYENNPHQPYAYYGDIREDYNGQKYMSAYRGLGIDIYSICFSMADDNLIPLSDMELIMQRISSNNGSAGDYCFSANTQDSLTSALKSVVANMSAGATDAYYTDTMGDDYDLYYEQVEGVTKEATIKVMEYALDANGKRTGDPISVRETITFAKVDGVYEAYSDQVSNGSTNIWDHASGLIQGKYVIYNTNTDKSVTLTPDSTVSQIELLPETFFWAIGNIGQTDLVLEYQVYLTGSMEGQLDTKGEKTYYDTNKEETLTYKNYLGNECTLSPASPRYPWVTVHENSMNVDKTVEKTESPHKFKLTLEAYATGSTVLRPVVKPADIVLVLDQSASMYTPKGAGDYRYDRWYSQDANTGLQKISTDQLDKEKGSHLGYYVAQTKEKNRTVVEDSSHDYNGNGYTGEALNIYDWFIVQYVDGIGWVYVRVADTTTPVSVDIVNRSAYEHDSGQQYYKTLVNPSSPGSPITGFNYYQSQYGSLYESVTDFVNGLAAAGQEAGVEHRVAITGFSSPYYDGIANYNGSGLYIDGTYYLYDSEYRYMGYRTAVTATNPHGYVLFVPDALYASMESILPVELENVLWSRTAPEGAQLIPLDPNQANSAGKTITVKGKTFQAGQYFAPVPAEGELLNYNALTQTQYANALMPVLDEGQGNPAVNSSLIHSIEAIRTNYMQTCPAAGLEMAQKIFENNPTSHRDQIVILFTDGVPTVSLEANREYGESGDARQKEAYWSGLSGVKDAVNLANELKQTGIRIYTIGTSALTAEATNAANIPMASGAVIKSVTGEQFLEYVSSDYQGISATHTVKTPGQDTATTTDDDNTRLSYSVLTFYQTAAESTTEITASAPAAKTAESYAKSAGDGDFSVAFRQIMQSVSTPNVTLDETAVLKEYLSDYFDLDTLNTSDIQVYVAPYAGTDATSGEQLFGEPVLASTQGFDISVSFTADGDHADAVVNVSGFSYSDHYVRQDPDTDELLGYKLIVKVPIKARPGFWGGNNVPTNKNTTAIYDENDEPIAVFPEPQVNVPVKPVISARDQVVYYGENKLNVPDHLVDNITVDGKKVTYDRETGTFTPQEEWMDDFAGMTWNPDEELIDPSDPDTKVSGTKGDDYSFGVILTPTTDGTSNNNPGNPGNIAGTPVSPTDGVASDPATGSVDVLVPVITFEDSTILLGDPTGKDYYESVNRQTEISWVNKEDPYGDKGLTTTPTEGFETQPQLSYSYSVEGTGNNYFTKDTPVNVEVHLGETPSNANKITDEVYFDWNNCDSKLHDDRETVTDEREGDGYHRHSGSSGSYEFYIHVTCILQADTVIIDFGIPVDIDATYNDVLPAGATLVGVSFGQELTGAYSTNAEDFQSSAISGHGTLKLEDGKLRYTPAGMKMDVSEEFRYAVAYQVTDALGVTTTRYYHSTVTVIPATVIYYEDSFVKFYTESLQADGKVKREEGGWSTAGETSDLLQQQDRPGVGDLNIDANNIYGFDGNYQGMAEYSYGSAKHVKVRNGGTTAVAAFSFKGTGFDVISLSSSATGTILVTVTDKDGKEIVNYMVDSYYGYRFVDGQWQVDPDASDTLYQVPLMKVDMNRVVKVKDDPATGTDETEYWGYGEYNVEISVAYAFWLDHGQCTCEADAGCTGCYDFYLDAIRIYDPADNGSLDETVKGAYLTDHEYMPTYEELRNHLISRETFSNLTGEAPGIIFIDGNAGLQDDNASGVPGQSNDSTKKSAIADYANYGPNNELYLAPGQAVAFRLTAGETVDQVHLALKSVGGDAVASVYGIEGDVREYVLNGKTVSTATDLYYNITGLVDKTVVIRNAGDKGMLSITNIKTTHLASGGGEEQSVPFTVSVEDGLAALASIHESEQTPVRPDGDSIFGMKYASLTFEDALKMNIYFTLESDPAVQELGLLIFDGEMENGTLYNAREILPGATYDANTGFYRVSTSGIAAAQLVDTVWFRLYLRQADGTVVYGKLRSYSPRQYADTVFSGSSYSEKTKALAAAMLHYGAAAQLYFGYRTDALITDGVAEEYLAMAGTYSADLCRDIRPVDAAKTGAFTATEGAFSRKYPSVAFQGAFSICYNMTPAQQPDEAPVLYYWTQEAYDAADTLTLENASGAITMDGTDAYRAAITGIAPKDMNETVYAAVVYRCDGLRYCSGVLTYSLGAYFRSMAAKEGSAMQPLAAAAAVYAAKAEAYFE